MTTLSPSAFGRATWNYAFPARPSPPAAEPGRLRNFETKVRRECDGVHGILIDVVQR